MSAFGLTTIPPPGSSGGSGGGAGPSSRKGNNVNGNGAGMGQHSKNPPPPSHPKNNKNFSNNNRYQQQNKSQDQGLHSGKHKPGANHNGNNNKGQGNHRKSSNNKNLKSSNQVTLQQPSSSSIDVTDPEYVVQTKIVSSKAAMLPPPSKIHDQFIGPLIKSPESLGYQKLPFKQQELPNYLIHEEKFLDKHDFKADEWDLSNQQKMLSLEQNIQDTNELMEILEKMRDVERTEMENRGLVDKANVSKSLADAIVFRGSCLYMCPVFEKVKRTINGDTSKYERDPLTNTPTVNSAIKAFSRSEAGQAPQLPSDVRPPHILVQTLDYMISNLIDKLPESESFIWNRTRSIRQDFTYQNYFGPELVYCIEKICRIHILTLHIMANSEVEYSQQQELEQLNKSLETLNEIYDDLRKLGRKSSNEAEFRAYYILSYYSKPELDQLIQNLPTEVFQHPLLQMAIMFRGYLLQNNTSDRENLPGGLNFFSQFFKACFHQQTPFLMSCLLEVHFNEVRFYALKSMSSSFHSGGKPYYANQLSQMLGFDQVEQLIKFVEYYELNVQTDNDQLCVQLSNFKFNFLKDKEKLKQSYSQRLNSKVEGKTYKEIIDEGMVISGNYTPPPPKMIQQPLKASLPLDQFLSLKFESSSTLQPKVKTPPLSLKIDQASILPQQISQQPQPQAPIQQQVKIVEPVLVPKKKKITELSNYKPAVGKIYDGMLIQAVNEELIKMIPSVIAKETKSRQRENLINSLGMELYQAFMNEAIHLAILEIQADKFREINLRKFMIRLIQPIALKSLEKEQDKKAKMNEFNDFKNRVNNKRINSDDMSMMKQTLKKKLKTVNNATKINYNDLWEPIDLEHEFIDHLQLTNSDTITMNFLVIVKDWNELSSKWLINKLGLRPNQTKTTFYNRIVKDLVKLKFTGLPDKFQELRYFQKTSFILFEIGKTSEKDSMTIEKKLKFDSKVMFKILEYIEKNCQYQVQIMILYYDASRSSLTMKKIEEILRLESFKKSKFIANVKICDMSLRQDLSTTLIKTLNTTADDFKLTMVNNEIEDEKDIGIDSTMNNSQYNDDDKSHNLKRRKRLEFIKSTLLRNNQPKIQLKTSTSCINDTLNKSRNNNITGLTSIMDGTFSKFNNNDIFQFQDTTTTTFNKPYLTTSTPIYNHARDISLMSNISTNNNETKRFVRNHKNDVGNQNNQNNNNNNNAMTKAIELRKLAASVLQRREKKITK